MTLRDITFKAIDIAYEKNYEKRLVVLIGTLEFIRSIIPDCDENGGSYIYGIRINYKINPNQLTPVLIISNSEELGYNIEVKFDIFNDSQIIIITN